MTTTFAVLGYNHSLYIEEAVEAALAQTGPPLQIILSDDCSGDETFSIMRKVAAGYRGPHDVLLNRNDRNLGLAEHLNRVAALARGTFIVVAAGDDISRADRAERIGAEFARGADVKAVLSGYTRIDDQGRPIHQVVLPWDFGAFTTLTTLAKGGGGIGIGATYAYHRDCFTVPGPLPEEVLREDCILPFRAALLGRVAYIAEPLVSYRAHGEAMTLGTDYRSAEYERTHQRILRQELDWAARSQLVEPGVYRRVKRALARYPDYLVRCRRLSNHPTLAKLYSALHFWDVWARRLKMRLARP